MLPAQVELLLTILYVVGCHIIQAHRVILYFNVYILLSNTFNRLQSTFDSEA